MGDYILQGDQEVAQYDMPLEQLCQSRYDSSPVHARVTITGASAISKLIPDDVSGSISYPTCTFRYPSSVTLTICASQDI